ncbi:MAG: aminotransferase class I/II-fold pyridoxal phosphate-dependent enzyme [Solobacterium sp.]|nr:aminotransferase class I/II-fold pyridoxal phosphate-dependent enzyme [Solobacterium sp.]
MMIRHAERMDLVHSDIRGPLYQEALRMISSGIPVLKLNTGNPAAFGFTLPQSVRGALLEGLDRAVAYSDSRGMPDVRGAILEYHRGKGLSHSSAEDIFIGNGVSEMAEMSVLAVMDPGDEMLVPCPNYSLWSNSLHLAGAVPVYYRCDEENRWMPDPEDIRAKITKRTKAILIINPNNPTGVLYDDETMKTILQIARENHLLVFADEIYDRLVMDGKVHHSAAYLAPDLPVITFNGLSKSHIICGFRCGWMILSDPNNELKEIRDALERLSSMRLCGNTLSQLVIPAALHDPESTQAMLVPGGRLYEQRKAVVEVIRKTPGMSVVPNDAAFYVFPKYDAERFHITSDKEFGMGVLKNKHVLIVPGSGFGYPTPDHFRIVMLPEAEELAKATQDIADYLLSLE